MAISIHTRRILRRQAWIALLSFAFVVFANWGALRLVDATASGKSIPSIGEFILTFALVVGGLAWSALRQPQSEIRSWVTLRMLWQKRSWGELFGFPVTMLVAGFVLGCVLSSWYWVELPPALAWQKSWPLVAISGLLGFCGGFAIFLPGTAGLGRRRAG